MILCTPTHQIVFNSNTTGILMDTWYYHYVSVGLIPIYSKEGELYDVVKILIDYLGFNKALVNKARTMVLNICSIYVYNT